MTAARDPVESRTKIGGDGALCQLEGSGYLRKTSPPFMTKVTRLTALMSLVGSPDTAITSAK
jgi:hypothetical protein